MAPSQLTDVAVPAERAVDYAQEAGRLTLDALPGRLGAPRRLRRGRAGLRLAAP